MARSSKKPEQPKYDTVAYRKLLRFMEKNFDGSETLCVHWFVENGYPDAERTYACAKSLAGKGTVLQGNEVSLEEYAIFKSGGLRSYDKSRVTDQLDEETWRACHNSFTAVLQQVKKMRYGDMTWPSLHRVLWFETALGRGFNIKTVDWITPADA